MFRVNSTSKQLVRLDVVEAGGRHQVDLLPKNFVFTEAVTDQMKMLEKEGVIRVKEVRSVVQASAPAVKPAEKSIEKPEAPAQPEMDGKLDFVNDEDSKIAKVQKKKK